jgi:hypothetical protein
MPDSDTSTSTPPPENLPGNTHLQAAYRPDWENSNPDYDDGQIHLEGEFDFPADQPARDVAESFKDRAEVIGGLVRHNKTSGHIDVFPWNGPGFFRLSYDPDNPDARVEAIIVFDGNDDPARHDTVDELIAKYT